MNFEEDKSCGFNYAAGDENVYKAFHKNYTDGCLVVEQIREAYRILSSSVGERSENVTAKGKTRSSTSLIFGGASLHREIIRRDFVRSPKEGSHDGVILRTDEAFPAICGVRAIWAAPSNRRKHITSNLLDAARRSFCTGFILDHTQLAFSPPITFGKALISGYDDGQC